MVVNQITEEVKNRSAMHRTMIREAPQRFYQQSEFIELVKKRQR